MQAFFYEFGPYRLDPVKRTLFRTGVPISLGSRAFDTLVMLLEHAGQTVTKEALIEHVWGDTVVEENNLTQCISGLRKAMGEDRNERRFIVTVSGRGYRFVAEVKKLPQEQAGTDNSPESPGRAEDPAQFPAAVTPGFSSLTDHENGGDAGRTESSRPTPGEAPTGVAQKGNGPASWQNRKKVLVLAAAVVLIGVSLWGLLKKRSRPHAARLHASLIPTGHRRAMLAVLPFDNLTGDRHQVYFSDGITQEIITQLGGLDPHHLGIIAWTSVARYRDRPEGTRQIAAELGAEYILEGSVRRSNQFALVSTQLIRASDRTELWASDYERPLREASALQDDVAEGARQAIARRLGPIPASAASASGDRSSNPAAFRAYLRGLHFFNRRDVPDLEKGVTNFQAAIHDDPSYAAAYAGLADCYTLMALDGNPGALGDKAKAAAQKSVALDESLSAGHTALAGADALFDWDWSDAGSEFQRALALNFNDELAHHWYAVLYLAPLGRKQEAIAEMERVRRQDPVSLIVNTDLGWTYYISGRYQDALAQYKKTLNLDPNFVPIHFRLAELYFHEGDYADWMRELADDLTLSLRSNDAAEGERAYRIGGYRGALQAELARLRPAGQRDEGFLRKSALDDVMLGRNDDAILFLAKLCSNHDPGLIYLKVDPQFATLRSDGRFQAMERRMGLIP